MQATETIQNNPDMNTAKEYPLKMPNTETDQDPETSTEIYPEIYPETRSTTYAASPTSTSSQEEITEIQIQPIQKQSNLSNFEETLKKSARYAPETETKTETDISLRRSDSTTRATFIHTGEHL